MEIMAEQSSKRQAGVQQVKVSGGGVGCVCVVGNTCFLGRANQRYEGLHMRENMVL